jgi:outer membrane protein
MKNLFLSIIILLYFINSTYAEQKIAFIDMNKVISTSKAGSSILKQLNNLNNKNLEFLKKEEKKFKEKETKLISQKNIISENEFKTKVDDLKIEIKSYKKNRKEKITNFNKLKVDNTNKLLKLINPIMVKFSNENNISIILQKKNLVVGNMQVDITDEIIEIINTDIKEFKIK